MSPCPRLAIDTTYSNACCGCHDDGAVAVAVAIAVVIVIVIAKMRLLVMLCRTPDQA